MTRKRAPRSRRPRESRFALGFSAALAERNVTLEWLRLRLRDRGRPVSAATLSYWRSGRSEPERLASLDALAEIEVLLGCEPGALRGLLSATRRQGLIENAVPLSHLADGEVEADALLRHLPPVDELDELIEVTTHAVAEVDAQGSITRLTNRSVVRALTEGASRLPAFLVVELPDGQGEQIHHLTHGASLTTTVPHHDRVSMQELTLDRPLGVGEETVVEHTVHLPAPCLDTSYVLLRRRRSNEVVLSVRFHPDKVPVAAEQVVWSASDGRESLQPLTIRGDAATVIQRGFGPGRVGIRWQWS